MKTEVILSALEAKHPGEICAGWAFEWRGIKED